MILYGSNDLRKKYVNIGSFVLLLTLSQKANYWHQLNRNCAGLVVLALLRP